MTGGPPRDAWGHLVAEQRARLDVVDAWWDLLGRPVGATLADVGCGPGLFAARFAELGADVLAVDVRPAAVAAIPRRPGLRALVHDLERGPLPERIDIAVLADVLHHVGRPDALLRNLRQGARRLLVAESLHHAGAGDRHGHPPGHADRAPRLAPTDLARMLAETGWAPETPLTLGGQAVTIARAG